MSKYVVVTVVSVKGQNMLNLFHTILAPSSVTRCITGMTAIVQLCRFVGRRSQPLWPMRTEDKCTVMIASM